MTTVPATKVWFIDGTTKVVPLFSRAVCEAQQTYGFDEKNRAMAEHYAVWVALRKPGAKFEPWLDKVAKIESAEHELPPDPTQPGPEPGPSAATP